MEQNSKIYVAGHRGLVGSALVRHLSFNGYTNVITRTHTELDLTDQIAVKNFFEQERPEYVFLAAAKVGGIVANNTFPAEFIFTNLSIQNNVIHSAWKTDVKRLIFLGSSCIYPRDCPQPILEDYLLTGPLESTNRPYALAKIAGVELCHAMNRQYGTNFVAAMPTNLYGPGDNYDLQNSHVLPALIRKMHEAKIAGRSEVVLWGSGTPKREFLYSDDLAEALVFIGCLDEMRYSELVRTSDWPIVNIGTGEDHSIREMAELIAGAVGYKGSFTQDASRPDGTMRKLLNVSKINSLGWKARIGLAEGIALTYARFQREYALSNTNT